MYSSSQCHALVEKGPIVNKIWLGTLLQFRTLRLILFKKDPKELPNKNMKTSQVYEKTNPPKKQIWFQVLRADGQQLASVTRQQNTVVEGMVGSSGMKKDDLKSPEKNI